MPRDATRALIEPAHPQMRLVRQCELLGLPRAPYDDHAPGDSAEHLQWMRLLEAHYTPTPYEGVRRMTAWWRSQGYAVNRQRVARRRRPRGGETSSPQPHTPQPPPTHRVSPYLLRGGPLPRGNHVWRPDSTYMRLHGGLISLVAVLEWFSRYVLSGAGSLTMDGGCCREALAHALAVAQPEIFHRDQGAQFTRLAFPGR